MAVYIWSDLHLGHQNIIDYEKRPFSSVEEMDIALIQAWKKTVKSNDIIINLGDFSWKLNKEHITKLVKNLPGYKILIIGNHDRKKSLNWWYDVGFDEVYKYPIIYDDFFILSHESVYVGKEMPYVNIHGHTHGESTDNIQKINVSVEVIGYKPIPFDTIKTNFVKTDDEVTTYDLIRKTLFPSEIKILAGSNISQGEDVVLSSDGSCIYGVHSLTVTEIGTAKVIGKALENATIGCMCRIGFNN